MRPHGRARVSSRSPRAFGICDRCGFLYNHDRLQWQFDWAGASLINKRILVCDTCNDVPQQQLRSIVVPADPTPIVNPRIQDYVTAETNVRYTSGQNTVDPVTNIPIIGGDARYTTNIENSLLLLENSSGFIELENGRGFLGQEYTVPIGEGAQYQRVTQQTGAAPGSKNMYPGLRFMIPEDTLAGIPYNAVGVPNTGRLSSIDNYVQWTNIAFDPGYWTNDELYELYWGA